MNMPDKEFSDIIKPKGPRYRYIHRILAVLLQCANYIPLKGVCEHPQLHEVVETTMERAIFLDALPKIEECFIYL